MPPWLPRLGCISRRPEGFPVEYHRALIKAEALRRRGDYGPFADVTAADAEGQVSQAERFLDFAVKLIQG